MLDIFLRRSAPVAVLATFIAAGLALPVTGQDSSSSAGTSASASSAMSSASAVLSSAPAANDSDLLAQGKHVWADAGCSNCHGTNGQGGNSADFPHGPNLRTSGLDPDTMLTIVECGLPGTRMPAWLMGAYTEVACNGAPLGPAPSDVLVSGAYSEDDLKALVDYIQVNFMKQPMPSWSAP